MAMVEQLAFSLSVLSEKGHGIHVLLWDDKGALYRVLLVTLAALDSTPIEPMLVSQESARLDALTEAIETRSRARIDREWPGDEESSEAEPHPLWMLFIQQASSRQVGTRLNGWRWLL
jgi:hypothetical protein